MTETDRIPAAEQAYATLRARILSGALEDGTRLKEQSLAEEMGLSRTPVREAIKRLLHEGFVERGEGYSTRVAGLPNGELDQIFEIRRRLECYAAERAATRATSAQLAELDALATELESLTPLRDRGDIDRISRNNAAFHKIIIDAAQSPRLTAVLTMAVDVGIVARTYHGYSEADLIRSTRHHRELVDALTARAPDWASHVMSSHVLAAAKSANRRGRS